MLIIFDEEKPARGGPSGRWDFSLWAMVGVPLRQWQAEPVRDIQRGRDKCVATHVRDPVAKLRQHVAPALCHARIDEIAGDLGDSQELACLAMRYEKKFAQGY